MRAPSWQTWLLGIFAVLLVGWVTRAEGKFDLVTRIEERLAAIQADIQEVKEMLKSGRK